MASASPKTFTQRIILRHRAGTAPFQAWRSTTTGVHDRPPVPIYRPGDFILVHGHDAYGGMIRFAQGWRFSGADRPYAYWNHCALITADDGTIQEALPSGMVRRHVSAYSERDFALVQLPLTTLDREQVVTFADAHQRDRYSWVTIGSIGLWLATGGGLTFGLRGSEVCSGFIARGLERAGYDFPDPAGTMPAELAKLFQVLPP